MAGQLQDQPERKLYDPPELSQHAKRGDPTMEDWPGTVVTREAIMRAAGDPRDWFRYGHRESAAGLTWKEFADARNKRRNYSAGYTWNQILILGDYGSGKTTLGIYHALKAFRRGHPVFSNASCLFGWHLEHEEMYTAMGFMPANAILLIDEGSAALASRVGHGVAVSSFNEMNLNSRKRNCQVVYMSAQDWEIASSVRRNCKEVWMPIKNSDMVVTDERTDKPSTPANDPANFRLVWHVWDDFPYRKANLIEGPDPDSKGEGFGAPTYTMYAEGDLVRRAFMLNDTFELAQAGAATLADKDVVKGHLAAFLEGRGPQRAGSQASGKQLLMDKLLNYFAMHEYDPPPFFQLADIAQYLDVDMGLAGRTVLELVPTARHNKSKGYASEPIYEYLDSVYVTVKG